MDWLTSIIVLTGLVILGLWTVVPVREFRGIFIKLRADAKRQDAKATAAEARAASDTV